MRYRVSRFATFVPLLIGLAATGCGEVQSGVCAGEQVDEIACTVDICDGEAKAWAHIPNDDLCEVGQRCDPTAGCVAAGALTGRATLFGHTDHSGITVAIDGVEGASVMTDAMGKWSFGSLPTGTYNVTYTKAKFITETHAGVSVLPAAASSPPEVELRHGNDFENGQYIDFYNFGDYYNGFYYSPDKKHVVVRYFYYYAGTDYYAYNLSALSPTAQPVFHDNYPYGVNTPFWLTNTHTVWTIAGQTVWSRPYDGGAPVILGSVFGGDSLTVMGNPGTYVVLRKQHNNGVFNETSLFVVKADGSTPMGAPVWVQPDTSHALSWVVNNDATALFGVNNSTASPPSDGQANTPLHRIDFATNAVSNVNTGFATNSTAVFSLSPDRTTLFGYLRQNAPNDWIRGFMIPVTGTAGPSLAPDYGAAATMYSDYPAGGVIWFNDNSGAVYATNSYSALEGGLKVWSTSRPTSNLLVASGAYANWSVHNKVVVYRDNNAITAPLRVVSAHSASPVSYPLDTSGFYVQDMAFDDVAGNSAYLVWTQSVSAGSGTRAKIFSALMPDPLIAAPTTVQLGGTLAGACAFEAVLSDRTYWQLCQDTGTLSGFTQSTTTAGTTTTMVRPGLISVPDGDRVAYRRYDGKVYSSPNTGTLTEVKLTSAMWDGAAPLRAGGKWIVFNDSDGGYLRASNVDGSGIDEPVSNCRIPSVPYSNNPPQLYMDPDKTHVLMPFMKCAANSFGEVELPTANLP